MNFSSQEGARKSFNEINITPLTDIFLVLLIIMMVIAPSFQSMDNSLEVPEINSGISVETKGATVSISKDGTFYLNEKTTGEDLLEDDLLKLSNTLQKKEVVVRADKKTKSSEIMKVMKAAQNAGYEKLVIAGEPLSKKEQTDLKKKSSNEVK